MAWLAIFLASTPLALAEQPVVQESLDDPSQRVTLNNWHTNANLSWVTSHLSIRPSMLISRGGSIHEFEEGPSADIGSIRFDVVGASTTVDEALEDTYTDGIIVIKNGAVVHEQYFGDFDESRHHAWASSTKSLTGMALGILISNGTIDVQKSPADYLPALRDSGYASITIRQLVDMTSSLDYAESPERLAPGEFTHDYFKMVGMLPGLEIWELPPETSDVPRGIRGILPRMEVHPELEQGVRFSYQNPSVDVAGWLIEAVSGIPYQDFVQEHIWKKLGAEHDAIIYTDPTFVPLASGGFSSTLRDAARFGMLMLHNGEWLGEQVLPETLVADTFEVTSESVEKYSLGAKLEDRPDWLETGKAYRNFWWIVDPVEGVISSSGTWGQRIYIDTKRNTVIAVFSSQPRNARYSEIYALRAHMLSAISESLN